MHGVSRKNKLLLFALASGGIGFLNAQQPPASQGQPKPAPQPPPAQQNAGGQPGNAADSLYHRRPGDGSPAKSGTDALSVIQQKALAADMLSGAENMIPPEFESYLNSAEVSPGEIQAYEDLFKTTVNLLRDRRQAATAVANLYELSEYPWDAGISRQLANRVLSFWDMRNNQGELQAANTQLQNKIKSSSRNADMLSEEVWRKQQEQSRREAMRTRRQQGGQGQNNQDDKGSKAFLPNPQDVQVNVDGVMGKLQLTEEYFNSLDSRARMKLNEVQMQELDKKARADFQSFVSVLYEGKRHFHARIAADFYRILFGDGDLPPEIAQQSAASSEIIRQTESDVEVFRFQAGQQKISSAAKLLREAFFRSQYHPALQPVARVEKLRVADYYKQLQQVQAMIEARDFVRLENTLQRMEKEIIDFDPTKPRALVEGVKRESQMRLGMAKLAAQQGNLDRALEEFKAAASAWPSNPDLDKASEQFFASQDTKNQGTEEFDRAIKEKNYRLVFDKQLPFAASIRGDALREEQLKKALEKVKAAELAYEKASLMERNRDPFGAWETLEMASAEWPDDSKLNKMRADVSVKAAEFVASVSRARDAEKRGDEGYALTWFLNAHRQYPPSQLASEAIERLSDRILGRSPRAHERRPSADDPPSASTSSGNAADGVARASD